MIQKYFNVEKEMNRIYPFCILRLFLVVGCREIPQPSGDRQGEVKSPTDKGLYSVFALSEDNAWAVGDSGVIIHWDGKKWSLVGSPTSRETQFSLFYRLMTAGCGNSGTILHYDSNNWHKVESPTSEGLCSVYFLSPYKGWAVGSGGIILHYYNGK